MTMTLEEALTELEALGNEKARARNIKQGASENQFGVPLGAIRTLAKKIKTNRDLGMALWDTGNSDARHLAILIIKPKTLSPDEMDTMIQSVTFTRVSDWLNAYIFKRHSKKEELRQKWLNADHPMAARSGWNLTSIRVSKDPKGLDLTALLDRLESEMGDAAPEVQWTMNFTLVEIGINFPEHRERALAIGESLGLYRDYPTSKGCTSPFAPIWINTMVSRQS